jgi:osmotically-inducible protein OsmY
MQIKFNRILSGVSVAVLLAALTGCESMNSSHDERSEGRAMDDKNISSNVKKAFENEPAYKLDAVHVNTFAGMVSLSGFVNLEGQKARAQQLAESVSGVRSVSNGITIKPAPMEATGSSQSRIYSDPSKPQQSSESSEQSK